ncbi:hypothetical protein, partial [Holospora obtusa]|uniref:hypothetical protein n=1 Tax=Holospora obtusa TaxID=49893 RepID=UPI00138ABEA8
MVFKNQNSCTVLCPWKSGRFSAYTRSGAMIGKGTMKEGQRKLTVLCPWKSGRFSIYIKSGAMIGKGTMKEGAAKTYRIMPMEIRSFFSLHKVR